MDYGDFTDPMDLISPVNPMDSTDPMDQSNETVQIDTQPPAVETDRSATNTNSTNPQTTATRPSAAQMRARFIQTSAQIDPLTPRTSTYTSTSNAEQGPLTWREVELQFENVHNLATTDEDEQHSHRRISAMAQRAELELQRYDSQAPSGRPVGFRRAVYGIPEHIRARELNAYVPLPNLIYPRPRSGYEPSAPMEPSNASPAYVPPVHPRVPGRGTARTDTPILPPDAPPSYVPPHARVPGRGAAGTDAPMQAPAVSQSTPYVPTQIGVPNVVTPEAAPSLYPIPGLESETGGLPAAGASRNMSHIENIIREEQAIRDAYRSEPGARSRALIILNRLNRGRPLPPRTSSEFETELHPQVTQPAAPFGSDEDDGYDLTQHDFRQAISGASGRDRTRVPGSQHRVDHADARRAQDEVPNLHRRADKKQPPPKTDEELTVNLSCKVCFEQTCTVVVLPCRR